MQRQYFSFNFLKTYLLLTYTTTGVAITIEFMNLVSFDDFVIPKLYNLLVALFNYF